jgi:hypothetical protein
MNGLLAITAAFALIAGPSLAQSAASSSEVVTTAPAKTPNAVSTESQIADWIKGAPPLGLSDEGPDGVISAAPDRGVHGEAGAFFSNHGYGGYVAATMPVGKDSTLGLAVADQQYNGRYFHGNSKSLAASLSVGQPTARPPGCPGGVQVGNRYVEPLWASQMRGAPLADDPTGCFTPATTGR